MSANDTVLPALDEPLYAYVYRRLISNNFRKKGVLNPDCFVLREGEQGLSVFRADIATPYDVLQNRIDNEREQLKSDDQERRTKAQAFLETKPDVETLVHSAGYKVLRFRIADIEQMGFELTQPDSIGHLEIRENALKGAVFAQRKLDIKALLDTGAARILSVEECLARK